MTMHCFECDEVFEDDGLVFLEACPSCGKNSLEDWESCICTECGLEVESNPGDSCPECCGDLEEDY